MGKTSACYDRLTLDDSLKITQAQPLENLIRNKRPIKKTSPLDTYTNYLPNQTEPSQSQPLPPPTLPIPELASSTKKKKKNLEAQNQEIFKPFGHFGKPFNTSSGSDIGFTPHPQLIIAKTVEDCTQTMAIGRHFTTQTILKVDHAQQEKVEKDFHDKLKESIEKAKEKKNLTYLQTVLQFITIASGVAGGIAVQLASASSGNLWGVAYGTEMCLGSLLSLGSFCLNQMGSQNSLGTSLMTLSGALLSMHGGGMGSSALANQLPQTLVSCYSSLMTLLNGYGMFKGMEIQTDLKHLSGDLAELQKKQKEVSDDTKKDYGALNITDFKNFFKAAVDFTAQTNQAAKKVVQGTLVG